MVQRSETYEKKKLKMVSLRLWFQAIKNLAPEYAFLPSRPECKGIDSNLSMCLE